MGKDLVPGIGVAGQVMCRNSSLTPKMCLKQGCESWVELKQGDEMVARCSSSWLPILMVELRGSVDKLREALNGSNKQQKAETTQG